MRCITFDMAQLRAEAWRVRLEDAGEAWQVTHAHDAEEVVRLIRAYHADVVIFGGDVAAQALHRSLAERPPIAPPYIVLDGWHAALCDAEATPQDAYRLALLLAEKSYTGAPPLLCAASVPRLQCLARSLLTAIGVRRCLRAMAFLPDMLALCTAHPPLLDDLNRRLYPLVARRHGLKPQTVERSLRLLIESTWNGGRLDMLERFFGHSVDPERGKPTNKEFLAQLQQRLMIAAERMGLG